MKNKGVTIVSLVITIIVMLILVGVSITIAENGGLYNYAENAVGETKNAIRQEQALVNDIIDNHIKTNVTGNKLPENIKIGDYVNYTPKTGTYKVADEIIWSEGTTKTQEFSTETGSNALKWRVWSIDEENQTVELVSATATTSSLYLEGAEGYNHGVDVLNDLCKSLYSDSYGSVARCLNVADINNKTNVKYSGYGVPKTPENKYYPALYETELGSTANGLAEEKAGLIRASEGVRNSDGTANYTTYTGVKQKSTLNVTNTWFNYSAVDNLISGVPADLIDVGSEYWLASRMVYAGDDIAYFGFEKLCAGGSLSYDILIGSNVASGGSRNDNHLRVIVDLTEKAELSKSLSQPYTGYTYWEVYY